MIELTQMFNSAYTIIPERKGERFTSEEFVTDTETLLDWKPINNLKDWINNIITE
jgi:hypothetical protein